jgi:RNA polymerase sigma-70 factor, ECF subfamily
MRATRLAARREVTVFEAHETPNFQQAILPHLDAAYNLARWLMRNEHDAQDAVQEAYLRAFRFFPGFRGGDGRAWLMKIVRNTCNTLLHANRLPQSADEFDENVFPPDTRALSPEEVMLQDGSVSLVRKAVENLPPNIREILVLREIEGMSYREIADIAGIPLGTVMSTLSRGRTRLRAALTSLLTGEMLPSSRQASAPTIEKQMA